MKTSTEQYDANEYEKPGQVDREARAAGYRKGARSVRNKRGQVVWRHGALKDGDTLIS